VELEYYGECCVSEAEIELLIKQEGLAKDYLTNKRQMDFIGTWQKVIDVTDVDVSKMAYTALRTFQNHFSLDRALYVWYEGRKPKILYDNTKVEKIEEIVGILGQKMKEYTQGFVVSKISDEFFEHQDVISYFGVDDVCSFAAVPFFKNGKLSSLLVTYIRMKDNWHSSIERYMLDESDLNIYQLLFRELSYSINRLESGNKVREMNRKLQKAAVTDVLTGIHNRAGMFEEINRRTRNAQYRKSGQPAAIMFIDLDNFKPYNDTYGHDVGDIILKEMAAIFTRASENKGFVSRYGGDEFIIVVNTNDRAVLEGIAKQIYQEIDESNGFQRKIENYLKQKIVIDEKRKITCSIGIATAEKVYTGEEFEELIKSADDLLYSVKKSEKGHYAFI
jgi:diguanylate cyclase (GGDEF)-like protein